MRIHTGAEVAEDVVSGKGTTVWPLAQIREGARLGAGCVIGRGAYVGPGVIMGDNCKVQNHALVYEPAVLEDGVFVGPGVIFTNDRNPRAISANGQLKRSADWAPVAVIVRFGASVGARAVCVAPVTIGRWALVAAGSVVTKDVADFSLVAGVPASHIGWVGKGGFPLEAEGGGAWRCPQSGDRFVETDGFLAEEGRST